MIRRFHFLLALLILAAVAFHPESCAARSANSAAQRTGPDAFPEAISQCEQDQCTRGGGGAIWIFEGRHGQALWHFGAVADLTVESYDGRTVVIRRSDPVGTYSSRFGPGGHFTAVYTGTVQGDHIDGTVIWNGTGHGTWYATIPKSLCNPFTQCPLNANQVVQLGQNAAKAKQYSAALHCFLIAGWQGNAGAQSLAGLMLRDGVGARPNYPAAFHLLQKSAEQDDYNGELGLAQMYESGMGTPKDPEKAAFWKNRAQKRAQELRAQQAQRQMNQAVGVLLFLGLAAAIVADAALDGPDNYHSPDHSNDAMDQLNRRQGRLNFDYWSNGGTDLQAPPGYECSSPGC